MKTDSLLLIAGGVLVAYLVNKEGQSSIGKLEDVSPRRGGRIDRYWLNQGNLNIQPWMLIGRAPGRYPEKVDFYDAETFIKYFNLHGVEFGNWMSQADRYEFMFASAIALNDLSNLMGISSKRLGKNKLSIALGARGRGPAMAHYESGRFVINITKHNGPGALAHEFGHYIDHRLGLKFGNRTWLSGGDSKRIHVNESHIKRKRGPKYHMEMVFKTIFWRKDGQPTKYLEENQARKPYFRERAEVWARTFEAFVYLKMKDQGLRNYFLIREPEDPWPQLEQVRKAFKHIEALVKAAL